MKRSVIILAGGSSTRLGREKAFMELMGKPLISHVFEKVEEIGDEVLIVVGSLDQEEPLLRLFDDKVKIVADSGELQGPLVGALAGFENALGEYSLLLPCDTPFLSREVLTLLFDISVGVDAVIPRWPEGYIEPLQAVYRTRPALLAARKVLAEEKTNMRSILPLLKRVRYLSTIVLEEVDPQLKTFFNVNTMVDLKRAQRIGGPNRQKKR